MTTELEKQLDGLLRPPAYRKITTAKRPTWLLDNGTEGLEIDSNALKAFKMNGTERIYGETPGQQVQAVIDAFMNRKKEEKQEKTEQLPATAGAGSMMIPDSLTMELLEKWRVMKTEARMFMFQNTALDYISERAGPGGSKLKYVKGNVMVQELNIAFLFNWSSTIEEVKETETGFWCRGYIEVWMGAETGYVKRSAIGTADKHKGVNSEDVAKAAAMDMIKKAASFLGFNGDVYRGEV